MRINSLFASLVAIMIAALAPTTYAADKFTADEAKALTLKAAALIQEKGLDGARPVLHATGDVKHGEVYVNVIDMAGTWRVYPPMPAGEGRSVLEIRDANGKFIVREIIKTASDSGEGWVEYRWMNPETKEIGPKISFVKRVPGTDLITYVGTYK